MKAPQIEDLAGFRTVWDRKPTLRVVYDDLYDRIAAACRSGVTIEIGSGIGNLKQRLGEVVSTDIQPAAWLDSAPKKVNGRSSFFPAAKCVA